MSVGALKSVIRLGDSELSQLSRPVMRRSSGKFSFILW